jgi:hypothetical protein
VAALLVLVGVRVQGAPMSRPLDLDEYITLINYTWAELRPDGEIQGLGHIEDFYALPRPNLIQLAAGAYCCLGRWREPNNHILNSALVNASLVLERSERAMRWPALLGAAAFAGALYVFCGVVLQWRAAAPLALLWAWFVPYVIDFSQTSRGYSWTLALQILFLLVSFWLASKPSSLVRGTLCAALAVLTFLNLVSMAVDWLVPVYLALYLFPPGRELPAGARSPDDVRAWRRSLSVQVLAVGALGLMFLLTHLPSVYSSARQYGLSFASSSEFVTQAWGIFNYLFSGFGWKVFAALAVVGFLGLAASRRYPFLTALVLLTFGINLAHFVLTRRLPYDRSAGYVLPLAMLGVAYLVEQTVGLFYSPAGRLLAWAACAGLTALLILGSWPPPLSDQQLTGSRELSAQAPSPPGCQTFWLSSYGMITMYRPREWLWVNEVSPGMNLRILDVVKNHPEVGFSRIVQGGPPGWPVWRTLDWESAVHPPIWPYALIEIAGQTRSFPDAAGPHAQALVFWYPDPTRLGLTAKPQLDHVKGSGVKYISRYKRYQAKLDIYMNLECVILIAESESDYQVITELVREGLRRFGGRAVVFVPSRALAGS